MDTQGWNRGRLIGSGSFGTVSLAHHKTTGWVFAVKSVSPISSPPLSILSLENEIQILKKVSSPHIVSYLGDDTTKEANSVKCRNLHMEFIPGGTVAELAAKRGGLQENELRGYARCLTRALHYLHSVAGIVHGDVKGRNLLVGSGPDGAKLSDFGSAEHLADMGKRVNWIGGTPCWMAPEVARGETASPASDVWSLGCTVIEMATGTHPWSELGLSNTDVAGSLLRIGYDGKVPKYPKNLSNDGRDFLDKCLKLKPMERWGCEKLLLHPFLADMAEAESRGPSPRGVLDWDSEEFGDESEEHGFEFEIGDEEEEEVYGFAMERLRSLCSESEESLEWGGSEGWETVRWVQEEQQQQQERTVSEGSDFERGLEESVEMSGEELEASGNWPNWLTWLRLREERSRCHSHPHSRSHFSHKDGLDCHSFVGPIGSWLSSKPFFIFYFYCIMINFLILSIKLARSLMIIIKLYLQFSCCSVYPANSICDMNMMRDSVQIAFTSSFFCVLHTRIGTLTINLCATNTMPFSGDLLFFGSWYCSCFAFQTRIFTANTQHIRWLSSTDT